MAWRHDPVILKRLPRVEQLHLAGWTNVAIAVDLDVSEATIRDDLKRVQVLMRERASAEIADHRAVTLARLEDIRVRALKAAEFDEEAERAVLYGDSIKDAEEGRRRVHRDAKGSAQFKGQKAAALNVARQATMDQAKLLGIDVNKLAITDSQGDDLPLEDLMARFSRRREKDAEGQPA